MKKRILMVLCVLAVLVLASCTSTKMDNLAYGVTGKAIGDFEITLKSFELIGGAGGPHLVGMTEWKGQPLVKAALDEKIAEMGGSGVINLKIQRQISVVNTILNYFTQGIYAPEDIYISGTVIK